MTLIDYAEVTGPITRVGVYEAPSEEEAVSAAQDRLSTDQTPTDTRDTGEGTYVVSFETADL